MFIYRIILLAVGVFACSTAVIMIKMSGVHPILLSAYRLLVAAAVLGPLWLRSRRRYRERYNPADLRSTVVPAILLGVHFITWIIGARMTLAANASLIVNMVPAVMPFLSYLLWREWINRGEAVGTLLALAGVLLLGAADYRISMRTFGGDLICFVSMFFFAGYLNLSRRSRRVADIWLYIVPLYALSGIFCLGAAAFVVNPFRALSVRELLLVTGLGVIPTVIGHSSLLYLMKHMRPQLVAIGTLGQFVFAGILAYFILNETPEPEFYAASALLIVGAVAAIRATPGSREERVQRTEAGVSPTCGLRDKPAR